MLLRSLQGAARGKFSVGWLVILFLVYYVVKRTIILRSSSSSSRRALEQLAPPDVAPSGHDEPSAAGGQDEAENPDVDEDPISKLARQLPNLPVEFLATHAEGKSGDEEYFKRTPGQQKCAKLPRLFDLHLNNIYWQQMKIEDQEFYLWAAYMDTRYGTKGNPAHPAVRVLLVTDHANITAPVFCHMWYRGSNQPEIVQALPKPHYLWLRGWGLQADGLPQGYIVGCPVEDYPNRIPMAISLVKSECEKATNILKVKYDPLKPGETKKDVAVCVKGMSLSSKDPSKRMAEWIELMTLLGADKVFLYELNVGENLKKVLDHFVGTGQVDLTPLTLPGFHPNVPLIQQMWTSHKISDKRKNELIPYNDCVYRNMYKYKFLAIVDVDEVIMPKQHDNWHQLIAHLEDYAAKNYSGWTACGFSFRNVYFMDEINQGAGRGDGHSADPSIPPYMHILSNPYRTANYSKPGFYIKSFVRPDTVLAMHNHYPFKCYGSRISIPVPIETAHLAHYRSGCQGGSKGCLSLQENVVWDDRAHHFKDELVRRTTATLAKVGLI